MNHSPAGPTGIPICVGLPYSFGQYQWLPGSGQQHRDALPLLSAPCSHEQVQPGGQNSSSVVFYRFLQLHPVFYLKLLLKLKNVTFCYTDSVWSVWPIWPCGAAEGASYHVDALLIDQCQIPNKMLSCLGTVNSHNWPPQLISSIPVCHCMLVISCVQVIFLMSVKLKEKHTPLRHCVCISREKVMQSQLWNCSAVLMIWLPWEPHAVELPSSSWCLHFLVETNRWEALCDR